MASWIRSSGMSLVMTTLTMSGSAAGQTTTLWSRSLVLVSSRRAWRPAIVGELCGEDLGPTGCVRARGVEVADQVGGQARCGEDGQRQRPLGPEGPCPAAEAQLPDARGRQQAHRLGRAVAAGIDRPRRGIVEGPRDAGLEVRIRAGRRPVGRAGTRRIEGRGAVRRRSRPARAARGGAWRRGRTGEARREAYPCSAERARRGVVRGCTWYGRPGVVRARARPSGLSPGGQGSHCRLSGPGLMFWVRRPAIEPGTSWGVGHGTGNGLSF